ncbi:MAG: DNA replication and repair protein RecF, partial [Myxococcota bacterium]|nr:DNA replication and repair protein RecF [Myxococcota bacterium]
GGPAGRRRFIDRAIFNVEPVYLEEVNDYLKALRHRNDLLRSGADRDVLASFDQGVISRGARILWRRSVFLQSFLPLFEDVFAQITDEQHQVDTSYQGLVSPDKPVSESDFEGLLAARLESSLKRDQRRGHTGDGPHMDDLVFHLDGHPARQHASQGQHRAFALSLKIAEMQYAKEALGSDPVLLLDDVSSELDKERNALLMRYLDQAGGQVFISTTDRAWIQITARSKVFQVDGGQVRDEGDAGGDVSQTSPYSA